jgi:hypothetical protein
MHPVIADVIGYNDKPTYEECDIPFGEIVAKYFKDTEKENVADLVSLVARICSNQGDYVPALKYYGYVPGCTEISAAFPKPA